MEDHNIFIASWLIELDVLSQILKLWELYDKSFLHLKILPTEEINYTHLRRLSVGDVIRFSCIPVAYVEGHFFSIHIPATRSPDST